MNTYTVLQSFFSGEGKRKVKKGREKKRKEEWLIFFSLSCSRDFMKRRESLGIKVINKFILWDNLSKSSQKWKESFGEKLLRIFFLNHFSSLLKKLGSTLTKEIFKIFFSLLFSSFLFATLEHSVNVILIFHPYP